METHQVASADDLRALIEERDVEYVVVALPDMQGLLRGKYLSRRKLLGALEDGLGVPPVIFAMEPTDMLYEVVGLSDASTGFPDVPAQVIPETLREIPWEPGHRNLFVMLTHGQDGLAFCPRAICQRVLDRAGAMGFRAFTACEFEFALFNETASSAFEKGYRNLALTVPHKGYSVLERQNARSEFYAELLDTMRSIRIPLEAVHEEIGFPSQLEASLQYAEGLTSPDNAVMFKSFAKSVAQRRGQLLSFMARWHNDVDGNSGHIHASLRDTEGTPVFFDEQKPHGISDTMRFFIGGLQKVLPELTVLLAPNVNSFKRFVPDRFAPTSVAWGVENRTVGLRAITGAPASQRLECRLPGADANPYLSIAATLVAGLYGIENRIEPGPETEGNAYLQKIPAKLRLPASYAEAIERFNRSKIAREWLGNEFVETFVSGRRAQEEEFRNLITEAEVERFLELS